MWVILKKELNAIFSSIAAYLVIGTYLGLSGLLFWFFKGDFNILDSGFADLSAYFLMAPWLLMVLVSALSMRSFTEEKRQGTLEVIFTKPLSYWQIIGGKYLATYTVTTIAILPSLIYLFSIYSLSSPDGAVDLGSTLGGYIGLILLSGVYGGIGIFCSLRTSQQIASFFGSLVLCLLLTNGLDGLTDFFEGTLFQKLSLKSHLDYFFKGVVDLRSVLYFLTLICLFLALACLQILDHKKQEFKFKTLIFPILGFGILMSLQSLNIRYDLTKDQRHTLSNQTKTILNQLDSPVIIDVFLKGKGFTIDFKRLQLETERFLGELSVYHSELFFGFIDPIGDAANRADNINALVSRGLKPLQIEISEFGKTQQELIFPWALVSYEGNTIEVPLIQQKIGTTQEKLIENSIQNLEYSFVNALEKLTSNKSKKIAILKGNGQLEDKYIADGIQALKSNYYTAPFTLDSVKTQPKKTLDQLKTFDLILSLKPTEAFTEIEKLVLDQYVMNGGISLWCIDQVAVDIDSLMRSSGETTAMSRDLNLKDFFFKYGLRLNPVLINDLYSAPITLASGKGSQTQFKQYPWFYSPLVDSQNSHVLTTHLNLVKFNFANQIDTLKNDIKKTILLRSSKLSKIDTTPRSVDLRMVMENPEPRDYNNGEQTLAVLLEGQFSSVYNTSVKPLTLADYQAKSTDTKMIVIADGDLFRNEVNKGQPEELGFDKWTGEYYGNKTFLLNAVDYLLGDEGLMPIRSKSMIIPRLNLKKVNNEYVFWQAINSIGPLVGLVMFGIIYRYTRRKKYGNKC